jgi:hypothetical protein
VLLIDGDIVVYRACYAGTDTESRCDEADRIIRQIANTVQFREDLSKVQVFLSGPSADNFRKTVATIAPYKGQRPSTKPDDFESVRRFLEAEWDATVSVGQEADDDIAIAATKLKGEGVICSIDKDFLQVPGRHYNWDKEDLHTVTPEEATYNLWHQIMTGDSTDNIKGAWMIGTKKADKLLENCTNEDDMFQTALKAYQGDLDALIENARLVFLRREEGQIWEPPTTKDQPDTLGGRDKDSKVPDSEGG